MSTLLAAVLIGQLGIPTGPTRTTDMIFVGTGILLRGLAGLLSRDDRPECRSR